MAIDIPTPSSMTATSRHNLLPETALAESRYAVLRRRLDELERQFNREELDDKAGFDDKLKAIDAQFKSQQDNVASLSPPLRETFKKVLEENRTLQVNELNRTRQQQKNARKEKYEDARQKVMSEEFTAITALMTAGVVSAILKGRAVTR